MRKRRQDGILTIMFSLVVRARIIDTALGTQTQVIGQRAAFSKCFFMLASELGNETG